MRPTPILVLFAACSGVGTAKPDAPVGPVDAPAPSTCASAGSEITSLPACGAPAATTVTVPVGCTPTVDGTLHADEWQDGACFELSTGGDTVYVKHDATKVYLAFSGLPACGCPMNFMFDPDGTTTSGDEFALNLFDDPFQPDGDRADWKLTGSTWVAGTAPAGIVTRCPGNQPSPIRYEVALPYAALGIVAGASHTFRLAIQHVSTGWPAAVAGGSQSTDPATWGQLTATW